MTDEIEIRLTPAQALVLFEWIARENEADPSRLHFEDPAEEHVLWILEGKLEKLSTNCSSPIIGRFFRPRESVSETRKRSG